MTAHVEGSHPWIYSRPKPNNICSLCPTASTPVSVRCIPLELTLCVPSSQEYAVRNDSLECFLTYADNNAVGYFAKQGFTKEITFSGDRVRLPHAFVTSSTAHACWPLTAMSAVALANL